MNTYAKMITLGMVLCAWVSSSWACGASKVLEDGTVAVAKCIRFAPGTIEVRSRLDGDLPASSPTVFAPAVSASHVSSIRWVKTPVTVVSEPASAVRR